MPFNNVLESGKSISIFDEGIEISEGASSLDFTGAGVTATTIGNDITVDITGGGGVGYTGDFYDSADRVIGTVDSGSVLTNVFGSTPLVTESGEPLTTESGEALMTDASPKNYLEISE